MMTATIKKNYIFIKKNYNENENSIVLERETKVIKKLFKQFHK